VTNERNGKPKRRNESTIIHRLPSQVLAELDERIIKRTFSDYRELKTWLQQRGCVITTVGVKNSANKLEERLAAIRLATEQARAVVDAANDDDVDMNEALLRLVQQHLFTVLVEVNGVALNPENIPALSRSVATLARAWILQRKYAEDLRSRITEKVAVANSVLEEAKGRGLSEAGAAHIKRALMEITE
jgi:anion-transporting  ArsA/GET3 family ATPase